RVSALVAAGAGGRAGAGASMPIRCCAGRARSNACARSWTVSASPMACAGSRTRNARSRRRTNSVRARLSIPRSRSIRLDAPTWMNRERWGCSSRAKAATIATMSRSREPWFAAELILSDCPDIEAIIRTRSGGALPWIKPPATVILRPAPPNQLPGRVPIRPAFQARRILRRSLEGFAFNSTTRTIASHRESPGFGRPTSKASVPGPVRRRSHWDPRCAAEALTPPDGIRSRSLPYWRAEANERLHAYILKGRGHRLREIEEVGRAVAETDAWIDDLAERLGWRDRGKTYAAL